MKILYKPYTYNYRFPANFNEQDHHFFLEESRESWPVFYEELEHLLANYELFVKKNIKILPMSFGHPWQDKKYNTISYLLKNSIKDFFRVDRKVSELVWILDQFSTGGYYHWLTEILPRIWMANELGLPKDIPVYFPSFFFHKWNFGKELLAPFGRSFKAYRPHEVLRISKTHFISQNGGPLTFHPIPLKCSTRKVLDYYYDSKWYGQHKRLYISRNKGRKRILINEQKIIPIVKRHGFKVLYTEELSMYDQVNLFSRAEVLMGLHGAGLTNMLFMEDGSTIFEIRNKNEDHMNNCFFALANACNHHYIYHLADTEQMIGESREIDFSLKVDAEKISSHLAEYL